MAIVKFRWAIKNDWNNAQKHSNGSDFDNFC